MISFPHTVLWQLSPPSRLASRGAAREVAVSSLLFLSRVVLLRSELWRRGDCCSNSPSETARSVFLSRSGPLPHVTAPRPQVRARGSHPLAPAGPFTAPLPSLSSPSFTSRPLRVHPLSSLTVHFIHPLPRYPFVLLSSYCVKDIPEIFHACMSKNWVILQHRLC